MMLALGAGSFTAGMFHLTTHAYFKALLFLAAGSVIHAVHTNDMREMGALRTNADNLRDFPAGYAGACRHPAVCGFYSKDEVLAAALWGSLPFRHRRHGRAMTAFYMARAFIMTFHGKPADAHKYEHAHENPPVMTVPLILLAALSWFPAGPLPGMKCSGLVNFEGVLPFELHHVSHSGVALFSSIVAAVSMGLGLWLYKARPDIPAALRVTFSPVVEMLEKRYWLDAFFLKFVDIGDAMGRFMFSFDFNFLDAIAIDGWAWLTLKLSRIQGWFDDHVVDAALDSTGTATLFAGRLARLVQTGLVQNYLLFVAVAVSIFAAIAFAG